MWWRLYKTLPANRTKDITFTNIMDTSSPDKIADIMNGRFCIISKLANQIHSTKGFPRESNNAPDDFTFRHVSKEKGSRLNENLSPSKACGIDSLTVRLFKAIPSIWLSHMSTI